MKAAFFDRIESPLRQRAEETVRAGKPLRAWAAPCGDGALAYSVAIVLIETLGPRWRETPLRVLATDDDPAAIARARAPASSRATRSPGFRPRGGSASSPRRRPDCAPAGSCVKHAFS